MIKISSSNALALSREILDGMVLALPAKPATLRSP